VELGEAGGGAAAGLGGLRGDGFAGGVVEVAEVLLAEAGAGAAASVGEDVAALVADLVLCFVHGAPPPGLFAQILQKIGVRSGPLLLFWLNAKARLGSRACLDFFVSSILPNWVKLVGQLFSTFIAFVLMELSCFPEAGGLDSFLLGFWGVEGVNG